MAGLKTKPHEGNVDQFLSGVYPESRREECYLILSLMTRVTGKEPRMWGDSIVGFDSYHYRYASGREGDWFKAGFSPRKQSLTLYIMSGFSREEELMSKLGKFKTGKSCLYINSLKDVDLNVLEELVRSSFEYMTRTYG